VKELDIDDDREAVNLKRINDKHDPHLIRLLLTYTYDGRFHMVFSWADGNLRELWESSAPQKDQYHHNAESLRWMSTQILGLSRALILIHYCEIDNDNIQELSAEHQRRLHRRHGDLKSENILWFKDEGRLMGTLKIADFGFADFHSEHSKSNVRKSKIGATTETYRAPEYDVKQSVSPTYDI
jgi:serine/threonine protein kinase